MKKGFKPRSLAPTLLTKTYDDELFLCQIYVDDIIFGCTDQRYSDEFAYMISEEYHIASPKRQELELRIWKVVSGALHIC